MKRECITKIIFAGLALCCVSFNSYGRSVGGVGFDAFVKSAGIYKGGGVFCRCLSGGYVFRRSESVIVALDERGSGGSLKVTISKWGNDVWKQYGIRGGVFCDDGLEISSRINEDGLYKLEFETSKNKYQRYLIICDNWKRLIFRFCRGMKDYLEINSDAELLRSTIAVSHFDNVMELAAGSEVFSDRLFVSLRDAIKAGDDFKMGSVPDFVAPGMTKIRLKRFYADDISEFVVYVPEDYKTGERRGLVVRVDPFRFNILDDYDEDKTGMIDLWWHFGSEGDFDWKDFEYFYRILNEKVAIDSGRVYMHSLCGNSRFAMTVVLAYPDIWAGCMMSTGYNNIQFAGNIFNAQFLFGNAHPEIKEHVHKIEFVTKVYHYFGSVSFECASIEKVRRAHLVDFTKLKQRENPERVYLKAQSYQNNKSYWVSIDGCEDDNFCRMIEAEIKEDKICVTTENTDAYSIYLSKSPIESSAGVEIVENDKSLGVCGDDIFVRCADKYAGAKMVKTLGCAGPIGDVFSESYVVVYQSGGGEADYLRAVAEFAGGICSVAKCVKDVDFHDKYIESENIIFVGRDSSDVTISEVLTKLPMSVQADKIIADGKEYQGGNVGGVMVYPNPLNRSKYFLFFAPALNADVNSMEEAFSEVKSDRDVGIYSVDEKQNIKYYVREKFDSLWGWSGNSNQVVFNKNFNSSAESYQKAVAKAIKKHFHADVSIVESVIADDGEEMCCERVVLRELFARFKNRWIIKIKVKGSVLKLIANKLVIGGGGFGRAGYAVSGMSFNPESSDGSLVVKEIVNTNDYVVALSAGAIKSEQFGYVLGDYEILDESFLIKLLKDYTRQTGPISLSDKCENIKIF